MQFAARVNGASACVRVQARRLEWSLIGRQWVIQMAPMSSITAIAIEPGLLKSTLVVRTNVGTAEFRVRPEVAHSALSLLASLMSEGSDAVEEAKHAGRAPATSVDELINLKWMFDSGVVDSEVDEVPARLLGF
jgi:hypothetical protein